MTTIACLKVFVADDQGAANFDALPGLVAKIAGAYLETTWVWPRRYGLVAPFSFVLADPRVTQLDPRELQKIAADLQFKLFGREGEGDVALLLFEGDQSDVMRFAGTNSDALKALLAGEDDGAFKGRICKITPNGVASVTPAGGSIEGAPPAEELATRAAAAAEATFSGMEAEIHPSPLQVDWWGIYYQAKERFVGSGMNWPMLGATGPPDDTSAMIHDLTFLNAAKDIMIKAPVGFVFLPINFSHIIKPTGREAYRPPIQAIGPGFRPRMAASVYNVPREPSYGAIKQISDFLRPYFSRINLQVEDPGFRVAALPMDIVESVTLFLSGRSDRERLTALNQFHGDPTAYRNRKVWQGVIGVRNQRELDLCHRFKTPFLSGPMIATLSTSFCGQIPWPLSDLPYRSRS